MPVPSFLPLTWSPCCLSFFPAVGRKPHWSLQNKSRLFLSLRFAFIARLALGYNCHEIWNSVCCLEVKKHAHLFVCRFKRVVSVTHLTQLERSFTIIIQVFLAPAGTAVIDLINLFCWLWAAWCPCFSASPALLFPDAHKCLPLSYLFQALSRLAAAYKNHGETW